MKTPLLVFHFDMNFSALKKETILRMLDFIASAGYNAVLWELENKVRWQTCPAAVDPEAMTKAEFRSILEHSRSLGLEPIPLLQTIGHAEYILLHEEYSHMRELPDKHDCYCVSNPDTKAFLKSLLLEYLELFGDLKFFHLGGDEAYVFGQCPVCSQREKNELYGEHINDLAETLRTNRIRPGIWNDMIMSKMETIDRISKDFVIWDWNYGDGLQADGGEPVFHTSDILKQHGFDVILCSASRSWGDSPFLPNLKTHNPNIAGAAKKVLDNGLLGNCVTSWAIRLVHYEFQKPLLEIAPAIFAGKITDNSAIRRIIDEKAMKYWEMAVPLPDFMEILDRRQVLLLKSFTAIGWNGLKDSTLPPRDYLKKSLDEAKKDPAQRKFLEEMKTYIPRLCNAIEEGKNCIPKNNVSQELLHVALELNLGFLETVYKIIEGKISREDIVAIKCLKSKTIDYFSVEQLQLSAERNASILFDPILHYCESR